MKRIITLLLIAIMLVTTNASVFAVTYNPDDIKPLTLGQFVKVLIGEGLADTAITGNVGVEKNGTLGLQTVYKNISPDQIAKFKAFNQKLDEDNYVDTFDYSTLAGSSGVSGADIKTLVKGIAQVMTFIPDESISKNQSFSGQYKADHLLGDTIADSKDVKVLRGIDRVAEVFYGAGWKDVTATPTALPAPNSAAAVLNTISKDALSKDTLTKNALGGLVVELKKELRAILKDEQTANTLLNTFQNNNSTTFMTNIKSLMGKAIANVFKRANPVTQLHLLKKGLEAKGMLDITGTYPNETVNVNSKFIQIIEKSFDLMSLVTVNGNTNYDIAETVANVNLAGVLDVKLIDSNNIIIHPNQSIDFNNSKTSVTFEVKPNPVNDSENLSDIQNILLTSWCNYAVYKDVLKAQQDATTEFNITQASGKITISPNTETLDGGKYVLKIYRRVAVNTDINDYTVPASLRLNTNPITSDKLIKDLFIEIPMSYTKSGGSNHPGSGGGSSVSKKYTVTTTATGSGGTAGDKGGTTIVTNSNGETGSFPAGTTVTIIATPKPGYKFIGWKIGDVIVSTDVKYTFVLGNDIDLVAVFVKDDLEKVSHNWYLRGYPEGTFNAERMLTRAEMAMVLYRISSDEQRQNTVPENAFSDVNASEWYTKAITFLKNKNILLGYENGEFRPNAPVTRAEMATMVSRYDSLKSDSNNPFSDVSKDHWAFDYIISASVNNWIVGYPDSTFKPNGLATRAETATLVNRVLDRKIEVADISATETMQYTDLTSDHWGYAAIMEATHTHKYTRKESGFELWSDIIKPYAGFND